MDKLEKKMRKRYKTLDGNLVNSLGAAKKMRKEFEAEEKAMIAVAKDYIEDENYSIKPKRTTITCPDGTKKRQLVFAPKKADYEFVLSKFQCLDARWRDMYEKLWKKVNGKKGWKKHLKKLPHRWQTQLDVNEV